MVSLDILSSIAVPARYSSTEPAFRVFAGPKGDHDTRAPSPQTVREIVVQDDGRIIAVYQNPLFPTGENGTGVVIGVRPDQLYRRDKATDMVKRGRIGPYEIGFEHPA